MSQVISQDATLDDIIFKDKNREFGKITTETSNSSPRTPTARYRTRGLTENPPKGAQQLGPPY